MQLDPNVLNEIVKVTDSEAGKALTLSATQEIGALLGDVANIVRFYATDNLGKVFKKWAAARAIHDKPLTTEDVKKAAPLLQAAAMVEDEGMQDRWATLLESVADGNPDYLPSFATTLSALTPEQARFIDRLWEYATHSGAISIPYPPGIVPLDDSELIRIFDPTLNTGMGFVEAMKFGKQMSSEEVVHYERLLHARTVIEDLIGLKIIGAIQSNELISFAAIGAPVKMKYALSHYGVAFISIVTPKQKK